MTRSVLQLRKGSTAQHASFTGQLAEITVDTTRRTVVVHDGVVAGGNPLAPLTSPTFLGTPTATTPTTGDSSTKLATTEFVAASLAAVGSGPANTDYLAEGTTNRYFTNARARTALSAGGNLSYDTTSGVFSYTQPSNISVFLNDVGYLTSANVRDLISVTGDLSYSTVTGVISYSQAVDSVNGQTGVVVLATNNVAEGGGVQYFTNARARNAISVTGPNVSYSTSTGVMTFTTATQIRNATNDSITLGTNVINFTVDNLLRVTLSTSTLATPRISARAVGAGADGEDLFIFGGDGGSGSGSAGDVTLQGGSSSDGNGGNIILTATPGIGSLRDGGSVTISSGLQGSGGLAGNITISSYGATKILHSNASAGLAYGSVSIGSNVNLPASPAGGAVYIYSSRVSNTASAAGSLIELKAANGVTGGGVVISAGTGTQLGGNVTISAGTGSGASFNGGNVSVTPGPGINGASTGTILLNGNVTVQNGKTINHPSQPSTDFDVTNRRYVNKVSLAYSIALG